MNAMIERLTSAATTYRVEERGRMMGCVVALRRGEVHLWAYRAGQSYNLGQARTVPEAEYAIAQFHDASDRGY